MDRLGEALYLFPSLRKNEERLNPSKPNGLIVTVRTAECQAFRGLTFAGGEFLP